MATQAELGPALLPGWRVYAVAREIEALSRIARECAISGPRQDLPRARAQLDRMRALLGDGDG